MCLRLIIARPYLSQFCATMDLVGRKGRILWNDTLRMYWARVIDYDSITGMHKVCWFDEYTFSELQLGRVASAEYGISPFWPDNPSPSRALAGKRIYLEPSSPDFLRTYSENPDQQLQTNTLDFRACVLCRADESPPKTYYVYYIKYNMIVTADLGAVRFSVLDKTDHVTEIRNPDAPKIDLDPPLTAPVAHDYIAAT